MQRRKDAYHWTTLFSHVETSRFHIVITSQYCLHRQWKFGTTRCRRRGRHFPYDGICVGSRFRCVKWSRIALRLCPASALYHLKPSSLGERFQSCGEKPGFRIDWMVAAVGLYQQVILAGLDCREES